MTPTLPRQTLLVAALVAALTGCALGPSHRLPDIPKPPAYKEGARWAPAQPADAVNRGPWWALFNDPVLDALVPQVAVSNQNVAAAAAAYAQARALVREQRAALFPSVTLGGGANRAGGSGSVRTGNSVQMSIGASWEPDVWGRLGNARDSAQASAEASAADLASAQLSAQGELVANYLGLRQTDAQAALLATTIAGYERVLVITQNRYNVGVAPKTDLLQAQTQLANAQADALALARQRAQLEHAIAVLLGKAPADFALAPAPWQPEVPEVPAELPSALLERRPDIAAAERRVAAANAQIGVAQAGYFPSLGLSASAGSGATRLAELFSAGTALWSMGLTAAQVIFDGQATTARVDQVEAAWRATVARYSQTVLAAFQQVEDQLAAVGVLAQQHALRRQASDAADQVEAQVLNRYNAGQVSFTEVVAAQVTALNARRALVQVQADRQTAAVALVQALGGGWRAEDAAAEKDTPPDSPPAPAAAEPEKQAEPEKRTEPEKQAEPTKD